MYKPEGIMLSEINQAKKEDKDRMILLIHGI